MVMVAAGQSGRPSSFGELALVPCSEGPEDRELQALGVGLEGVATAGSYTQGSSDRVTR